MNSDGVEDLTGGSSAMICSTNILSKDKFWTEGLLHVNKDFLFGLATQTWWDRDGSDGIQSRHAYSVLRAVDYGNERLVMIKNPWGKTEVRFHSRSLVKYSHWRSGMGLGQMARRSGPPRLSRTLNTPSAMMAFSGCDSVTCSANMAIFSVQDFLALIGTLRPNGLKSRFLGQARHVIRDFLFPFHKLLPQS